MEFASSAYGWLALLVPGLLYLYLRAARLRRADLEKLSESHLLSRLMKEDRSWVERVGRPLVDASILLLLVVALMRPQWGAQDEEMSGRGLDILIALDVSRSMLADDIPPSRFEAARTAARRLLKELPGDRIGLIAFAGNAFLICPLTGDHAIADQILQELSPESFPLGGSSLSVAVTEAKQAFQGTERGGRVLVVLSDGEDHAGEIAPALRMLHKEGVAVFALRVGTPEGGVMPLPGGGFVKDRHGAVVKSRASIGSLQLLDPAAGDLDADGTSLRGLIERARLSSRENAWKEHRKRPVDRYQVPLAAALFLLFLKIFLPGKKMKKI